jgi:hypothetical protein
MPDTRSSPTRTVSLALAAMAAAALQCGAPADPAPAPDRSADAGAAPSPDGMDSGVGPRGGDVDARVASEASPPPDGQVAKDPAGIFVAVGDGGRRIRSIDDGITWTDDVSIVTDGGGDDFTGLRTVTWGNGLFIAGAWRIMTSPDGKTWKDYPPNVFNQNWMGALAYGAGVYVGVGGYGSRVTSSNGATWTQNSIDTTASHSHGGLVFAPGKGFVAVNDEGHLSSSPDGVTWHYSDARVGTDGTTNIAYGNGTFVAIGNGSIAQSTDGATWSKNAPFAVPSPLLVFAQGHFTAIGSEHVYTSSDGATWTDHPFKGLTANALAYGHGTYVLIDGGKQVRRSSDALVWSGGNDLGGTSYLGWLAFGPG